MLRMCSSGPTAIIFPSETAKASACEFFPSCVRILAFKKILSIFIRHFFYDVLLKSLLPKQTVLLLIHRLSSQLVEVIEYSYCTGRRELRLIREPPHLLLFRV